MGIVADDIDRVRATVKLSDIVQPHTALRRVGSRWMGRCPFHGEKTPSFSVNDELGFYKCFGCGVSGDVITFVREIEHLDFVGAVESLAGKAGITLSYTTTGESMERSRGKKLKDAVGAAVGFYHERLLTASDAGPARSYLRSRGFDADTVRTFHIGWAPDEWDQLARALRLPDAIWKDSGLGFVNQRGRQTDAFRARIVFPIFDERGDAVGLGARIMPGAEGAKYKNSPETPIYSKSRTLYGLNWAKEMAARADQLVVCEGYTDVIGFHRAGVDNAVATCGTALTEEHVKLMRRFATQLVLAFDADAAGQSAADRVYAWEKTHEVSVSVASFPAGRDPGDLAQSDPAALVRAVAEAKPFLAFRLDRLLAGEQLRTPEQRARMAERALELVNEHPNPLVRRQYAGEVAMRCGLPAADLVALADRGSRTPHVRVATEAARPAGSSELTVLRLLVHRWADTAGRVVPAMFVEPDQLAALLALAEADGDVRKAVELAEPAAGELLVALAVDETDLDPIAETEQLLRRRVEFELGKTRRGSTEGLATTTMVRSLLHQLADPDAGLAAYGELLGWLDTHE